MKVWIVGLKQGTWVVRLLRNESLDSRAVGRNLDSRVTSLMKAWVVGLAGRNLDSRVT